MRAAVYRPIDQFGQVIDVLVAHSATPRRPTVLPASDRHDHGHARRVTTDKAPVYPAVLAALLPAPWNRSDRYATNRVEADHGRPKPRLRVDHLIPGLMVWRQHAAWRSDPTEPAWVGQGIRATAP